MASGCIANIIKTVLDILIDKDQSGFIKGRYIEENIRIVYDILKYTDMIKYSVFYYWLILKKLL